MQGRTWIRRGLTLFYFLPFALLVVFCTVLSFRDFQDWAPFWRTYLAGAVFVLLSTHFCYGAVWAVFSIATCISPSRRRSGSGRGVARNRMRAEARKMPKSLVCETGNGLGGSDDRFGIMAWFRSGCLDRCRKNRVLRGLGREEEPGRERHEEVPDRLAGVRHGGKFSYQAAGYVSFLLLLLIVYAMVISTFNLRIDKIDMRRENPGRPVPEGLRGYRILQISDLHIGSFTSARQIRSLVRQALLTRPDMIVFTGDMVNFSTSEMTPFMSDLAHLQAPDGVYCVLGNHDYGNYAQWPDKNAKYANFQKMLDYYKRLGWVTLNNASVKVERGGDTLWLVGVENWGKESRFPKRGNLKKAISEDAVIGVRQSWRQPRPDPAAFSAAKSPWIGAGTGGSLAGTADQESPVFSGNAGMRSGRGRYTVLLSHDPSHFDSVVYLRYPAIDLTLSGHTHGMQVGLRINGKDYSPARFVYEHFSGMYIMANGQALYVNTGCGFNGIPFRIGMRPNLTLFSL